ncbi:MAG: hypothetical protein EU550_03795 [Promethearchaeota archaeon]|nr:MAG: hypothetical protein EU550_03795 [Candidatus Lokiarchaeota archaeon]
MEKKDRIVLTIIRSIIAMIVCFLITSFFLYNIGVNISYFPVTLFGFIFLIIFCLSINATIKKDNQNYKKPYHHTSNSSNIHIKNPYVNKKNPVTNSNQKNHPTINLVDNKVMNFQSNQDRKELISYTKKEIRPIYCSFCGEKVSNTTKYCPMCGNKIIEFNQSLSRGGH